MQGFFTSLSLFIFCLAGSAHAEKVYRWVDENGQTHFSAQAPRTLDQDIYKVRVSKAAENSAVSAPASIVTETKKQAEQEQQGEAENSAIDPKQAKVFCQQAKEARQKLSENFNRRYTQPDGSARPLTDKERASMIKQADAAIAGYCLKK